MIVNIKYKKTAYKNSIQDNKTSILLVVAVNHNLSIKYAHVWYYIRKQIESFSHATHAEANCQEPSPVSSVDQKKIHILGNSFDSDL